LDPEFLELAVEQTSNCVQKVAVQGSCVIPAAPTGGWICGQGQCSNTSRSLTQGFCAIPGTARNTYSNYSICGSCSTCSPSSYAKNDPCLKTTPCACISSSGTGPCSDLNLCGGQPCPQPVPPPTTCSLSDWSDWSGCVVSVANPVPVQCNYDTGVAEWGIQTRTKSVIQANGCTGGVPVTETKNCQAQCPPQHCQQTPFEILQDCPLCWDRKNDPQMRPSRITASSVTLRPMFGGAPCDCPAQISDWECWKIDECDIPVCPTDCEVGPWSDWCPCDKSCYDTQTDCKSCTGLTYRVRDIIVQPQDGGKLCPNLRETQTCNETPCPIPCQLSTWSPWSQCNARCGGGQKLRTRYIILSSQYGGTPCGDLYEYQDCNTDPCPVSCVVSEWGAWDLTCPACIPEGTAPPVRTKRRTVEVSAQYNGSDCPPLEKSEQCPIFYCPIPCEYTPWTDYTDCTASCGGGIRSRRRAVKRPGSYGGAACTEPLYQQEPCSTQECPRDCVYYWSQWHSTNPLDSNLECSAACGGGMQQRDLIVVVQPNSSGRRCPEPPVETQPCNTRCCPVDCVVSAYDRTIEECQSAAYCPARCGLGFCARTRTINQTSSCGGSFCPPVVDWVPCQIRECPTPCIWSDWSGWSQCPSCGVADASIQRYRSKKLLSGDPDVCGGPEETQHEPCPLFPCPVDCQVGPFIPGPCSVTCGIGVVRKERSITVYPDYHGAKCPYLVEFEPCIMPPCVPPCLISDWSAWGPCSATCQAPGAPVPFQERFRTILVDSNCDRVSLTDSTPCNAIPCPVHCVLSDWTPWAPNPCGFVNGQQRCGLNLQTRHRDIIVAPANGGRICQITEDQQYCDAGPCEHPCEFTPWSEWSYPTATCGVALQNRHRYLLNNDGTPCPHLTETRQAPGLPPCPVDCEFYYEDWSDCSPQGYRRRRVHITRWASNGGRPCPTCQVERDDCTPPPSPVPDCWLEECDK